MPELPEVETIARQLRELVIGRRIAAFESFWHRVTEPVPAAHFATRLVGREITGVGRRGKFVVLELDGGEALIVSLRMTGQQLFREAGSADDRFTRAFLTFADGSLLRFADTRKFGRMQIVDVADLADAQRERRAVGKPLHTSLGIEALSRPRIHPLRTAGSLTTAEVSRLHEAIRWVLRKGIRLGGASRRDYVDARGNSGRMQREFQVYDRAGEPCSRCGRAIVRSVVGGRGTFQCPRCQRARVLTLGSS